MLTFIQTERQSSIADAERRLEEQQTLQSDLRGLQADIQEKKSRIEKIKNDIASSKYDVRLQEKMEKSRTLEDKREGLNFEIRALTSHADAGIKLDLKKGEIKSKTKDIQSMLSAIAHPNVKFLKWTIDWTLRTRNTGKSLGKLLLPKT
jgi:DNA repair protein RAD50